MQMVTVVPGQGGRFQSVFPLTLPVPCQFPTMDEPPHSGFSVLHHLYSHPLLTPQHPQPKPRSYFHK